MRHLVIKFWLIKKSDSNACISHFSLNHIFGHENIWKFLDMKCSVIETSPTFLSPLIPEFLATSLVLIFFSMVWPCDQTIFVLILASLIVPFIFISSYFIAGKKYIILNVHIVFKNVLKLCSSIIGMLCKLML